MASYGLLLSRLVPWLLVTSGILILARFVRDRLEARAPRTARATFVIAIAIAAAASVVYFARAACEVAASMAFLDQRWPAVDRSYSMLRAIRGAPSPKMGREWAIAQMHLHEWSACQATLLETAPQTPRGPRLNPDSVLMIGQCAFYEGDYTRAKAAFRAAGNTRLSFARSYFLAAIAEIEGDRGAAIDLHQRALRENPRFFPALYQSVRLLIASGRYEDASSAMTAYARSDPGAARSDAWRALARAIDRKSAAPPVINFYVLES